MLFNQMCQLFQFKRQYVICVCIMKLCLVGKLYFYGVHINQLFPRKYAIPPDPGQNNA